MKTTDALLLLLLPYLLSCSIAARALLTQSQREMMASLWNAVESFQKNDTLPGFKVSDHVSITTRTELREKVDYPVLQEVEAIKEGDPRGTVYRYMLWKETNVAPWQIRTALKIDPDGSVKRLAVK